MQGGGGIHDLIGEAVKIRGAMAEADRRRFDGAPAHTQLTLWEEAALAPLRAGGGPARLARAATMRAEACGLYEAGAFVEAGKLYARALGLYRCAARAAWRLLLLSAACRRALAAM